MPETLSVIIPAHQAEKYIAHSVDSVHRQGWTSQTEIIVIDDGSTDNTAQAARDAGAVVYERFNKEMVGKGYALDWLFAKIQTDYAHKNYDAYIIFDADNILEANFVEEMNKVFDKGYRIITSYRNSKNYGENWITAGYSLWFLREAKYLNNARMTLGTSCAVSGTGFLVSAEVIRENGGWVHHLLTEDIEFTADSIIKGEKIGYCGTAILYDEQPSKFHVSYIQRLRWAKGFYQVLWHYGARLFKGIFKGSFSCFDMLMMLSPAMLLTIMSVLVNVLGALGIEVVTTEIDTVSPYMLFMLLIFNPIAEEFVFRKLFADKLLKYGERFYVFASAFCFAIVHGVSLGIPQVIYTFVLGLVWGYVMAKTGDFKLVVLLHALSNLFGGVLLQLLMSIAMPLAGVYSIMLMATGAVGLSIFMANRKKVVLDGELGLFKGAVLKSIFANKGIWIYVALTIVVMIVK